MSSVNKVFKSVITNLENKRSKSGKLASSERISCTKSALLISEDIAF